MLGYTQTKKKQRNSDDVLFIGKGKEEKKQAEYLFYDAWKIFISLLSFSLRFFYSPFFFSYTIGGLTLSG